MKNKPVQFILLVFCVLLFCIHSFNGTSEQTGAWNTLTIIEENFSDSESFDADEILFKKEATTDWLSLQVLQLLGNFGSKNLRFALGFIRAPPTPQY